MLLAQAVKAKTNGDTAEVEPGGVPVSPSPISPIPISPTPVSPTLKFTLFLFHLLSYFSLDKLCHASLQGRIVNLAFHQ